ncbi:MAG TPA: hypothetical protein VKY74_22520 [Chloroflexia bacterium]|nr:hypothetical protein [Chloroflexia bacterium]
MTPNTIDPPASRPDSRGAAARAFVAIGLSLWALLLLAGIGAAYVAPLLGLSHASYIPAMALAGGGGLLLRTLGLRRPGWAAGLAAAVGLLISTLGMFTHPLLILGLLGGDGLIWWAGRWLWRAHPGWAAGLVAAALLMAGGSEFYLAAAPARPVDLSSWQHAEAVVLHPGEVVELTLECHPRPNYPVPERLQFSTEVLSPGPLGLFRQTAPVVRFIGLLPGTSLMLVANCPMIYEESDLTFRVTLW